MTTKSTPKLQKMGLKNGANIIKRRLFFMRIKERTNPKTHKQEYKARYYYVSDGKKHDSETGWFPTPQQAENEAKTLKAIKESADVEKALKRRDIRLSSAFDEFIKYLIQMADNSETSTYPSYLSTAKTLKKYYMPGDMDNMYVRDIKGNTFYSWLTYINNTSIGGARVRAFKSIISKFNEWLSNNGYYDINVFIECQTSIGLVNLKSKRTNNREDNNLRHIVTLEDVTKITGFYKNQIELFENFYYYTLFYVLFFSGMRVEEVIGLQWKFVDLNPTKKTIYITSAIAKLMDKDKVKNRINNGIYHTKNKTSVREIPIFEFYYELLVDYRDSYKHYFWLTDEQMQDCFVFPRFAHGCVSNRKIYPYEWTSHNTILKHLKSTCEALGLPATDTQMFRHSCAMFLILPPPDGLGFTEERVKDYFGHTDTKMLNAVYARLNQKQKAERMRLTFADIFFPAVDDKKIESEKAKKHLLSRVYGNNPEALLARKQRIFKQIEIAIKDNREEYYYLPKDKAIIEEYIASNPDKIRFVEE